MELTRTDFDNLRAYIRELCGLIIPDEKQYLITHRLSPLVATCGCASWAEFHARLTSGAGFALRDQIISAMTTNETSFFRDNHPFENFKNYILPYLAEQVIQRKCRMLQVQGPKVRIWSAASSTGQEPYTLAMLINEYAMVNRHRGIMAEDFGILATDISSRVLAQATAGEYSSLEIGRGLLTDFKKYFTVKGDKHVIEERIRKRVEFRKLNLTEPFQVLGTFDFIACRNVLIYFDDPTKRRILEQFHGMLSDGNYLMLGTSEGLYGLTDKYQAEQVGQTIIYRKGAVRK